MLSRLLIGVSLASIARHPAQQIGTLPVSAAAAAAVVAFLPALTSATQQGSASVHRQFSSTAATCTDDQNKCQSIMSFNSRSVDKKILSVEKGEGAGARVRRSIGTSSLPNFDPFLMLDEFRVPKGAGFPDHPHRGFETVTYMLEGIFEHEDFCGHRGKIGPGDLQWMTAGRGIVHAEMPDPDSEDLPHGLQLWVNLSRKDKMVEPKYQELQSKDIPHVNKDGVTAIVIAGEAFDVQSPVYTRTPAYYLHFKMEPGSQFEQKIPKEFNAFLYTLKGKCMVGPEQTPCDAHHTITLTRGDDLDGIAVKAADEPCEFVLIGGQPLNEPVVQHGPFVMNSRDEIFQTFMDYQTGKNGFEKAREFESEIGRRL